MEISEEEAESLLSHKRNGNVKFVPIGGGRTHGAIEIPPILREVIGVAAHSSTIRRTAEAFDVSESTVSMAKKGNVGVNRHDPELRERIDNRVRAEGEEVKKKEESLRDVAMNRLAGMFASVITEENLAGITKVREAVTVARDLATIVERISPKNSNGNVAVFIHAPRIKSETEYDAVDVVHIPEVRKVE
jgi:hypothetical protein